LNADLARTANSEGVNLFDSGYLNEARSKFLHALELNPGDQVAQANLAHSEAELAFKEHDYTRAVRRIRDAIDLGRDKLRERLLHFQHELERVEAQRRAEEERRQEIARKDAALFEVLSTPVATVRTPQVGAIANTPLFSATPILGTSLLSYSENFGPAQLAPLFTSTPQIPVVPSAKTGSAQVPLESAREQTSGLVGLVTGLASNMKTAIDRAVSGYLETEPKKVKVNPPQEVVIRGPISADELRAQMEYERAAWAQSAFSALTAAPTFDPNPLKNDPPEWKLEDAYEHMSNYYDLKHRYDKKVSSEKALEPVFDAGARR